MGKRYLLLIIAALLLVQNAFAAITVTPNAPAADLTQSSSTVSFNCGATESDPLYEISNVSLYIDAVKNYTQSGLSLVVDVTNVPTGAHTWYCEGVNNASATASSSTRTFTISSTYLTFSGTISGITFPEDTSLSNNLTLSSYFNASSTPTYSITGNTSADVIPSISAGLVSFSAAGNYSGTKTLTITATLGTLTASSNAFVVTVTAVNDAPYYTTIPAQNMTKNTNKTITLSTYFADVEGTSLAYNVSTAPSHMNYTVSGATVTLSPEPNWTGTTSITFSASDGNATTNSNSVSLVVSAGNATNVTNRAPSLSCPLGRTGLATGESATFTITKSDPDGDTLTVIWKLDNEVISDETGDSYAFSKDTANTYALKALVSDGKEERECSWTIIVSAVENYTSASGADVASIISEQTEEIARCGDGKIQENEDCATCPSDVVCSTGEVCSNKVCTPKTSSSTVLMVIGIIIAVILGGGFAAYKLTTRRKLETKVRDGRTLSQVGKELPSMDLHDIYEKESPKPDTDSIPQPVENPLDKYVHAMREKGVPDADIHRALKEKGWNDALIRQALKH